MANLIDFVQKNVSKILLGILVIYIIFGVLTFFREFSIDIAVIGLVVSIFLTRYLKKWAFYGVILIAGFGFFDLLWALITFWLSNSGLGLLLVDRFQLFRACLYLWLYPLIVFVSVLGLRAKPELSNRKTACCEIWRNEYFLMTLTTTIVILALFWSDFLEGFYMLSLGHFGDVMHYWEGFLFTLLLTLITGALVISYGKSLFCPKHSSWKLFLIPITAPFIYTLLFFVFMWILERLNFSLFTGEWVGVVVFEYLATGSLFYFLFGLIYAIILFKRKGRLQNVK